MKPENCNHCAYKENISQHWELEDYCKRINQKLSRIDIEKDCPLDREKRREYETK